MRSMVEGADHQTPAAGIRPLTRPAHRAPAPTDFHDVLRVGHALCIGSPRRGAAARGGIQ